MNPEDPFSLENPTERIVAAALRFGGRVFTGRTHLEAVGEMDMTTQGREVGPDSIEDGFLTNTGRFVERNEAGEIAKHARQPDHLGSEGREYAAKLLDANDIKELRNNP